MRIHKELDWRVGAVRTDLFPELDEFMEENEHKDREDVQALRNT